DKVAVNTAAVHDPGLVERLARRFGSQAVVLAVDARRVHDDGGPARWEVYVRGGRTPSGRDAVEWVREGVGRGAGEVLLTSMDRDGTKDGFDVALTRAVADAVNVPVVAWANAEALEQTARTGLAHFWSRRRGALWRKGETSGHSLKVREVRRDCDGDTLLMVVDPEGPTCHTGTRTCFGEESPTAAG